MYLIKTTRKSVLTNLLARKGLKVLPTRFADMIICTSKPPVMFEENGYIKGVEIISEKLATNFFSPPVKCPSEREFVCVRKNGQEFMGTVHEVNGRSLTIMALVLYQPRLIEVDLEDLVTQGV
jgi:hypothetical protein